MSIPNDALDRVTLLLSGASSVRDRETRAVYLAAARSLLASQTEKAAAVEAMLSAMEADLARQPKGEQLAIGGKP